MTFASRVSGDISAAERLREYYQLVQELSVQVDPHEMLTAYRKRSQFIVPHDAACSFSRYGLSGCAVKLTRSTRWDDVVDPWKNPEKLPTIESGLICALMRAARPVKMDQLELDPADPITPHFAGMQSLLATPIFRDGQPVYLVTILRQAAHAFTLEELATLVLTANLVGQTTTQLVQGLALKAAYAALDREFSAVGAIQRDLLPRELPEIPGVRLATHYETSTQAGGDYYDFFPLDGQRWGVLIADVSGHGAPAAVVMARMHALLHGAPELLQAGRESPAHVLSGLNTRLHATMQPGSFVTAFYGVLDAGRRQLQYASAGHNPPRWLQRANGVVQALDLTDGIPLGIAPELSILDKGLRLGAGDRLMLYTDGVTESFAPSGGMFGVERLDAALACCSRTPESMISCVMESLTEFVAGQPPADDRTLVALAVE